MTADTASTEKPPSRRRVGILGGMGPAATVDLMQKIIDATPASCDQEHVPLIVWNVPQIPPRVSAIMGDTESPEAAMCDGARWLANAGADAIAIACNTAHYWAEAVEAVSKRPVIHIADAALAALGPKRAGRVMLLATPGTLRAGFYATRFASRSVTLETPAVDDQRAVNNAIAAVKAGETDAARATLLPILGRLANEGVELFLLGCTELPIAVRGTPFQAKSIDATDALALAIVAFSLNPDKP